VTKTWLWAALVPLVGCGAVDRSYVRKDFDSSDRTQTIRVAVVTSPFPDENEAVGRMWSLIAQRYVNDHRDYIVREAKTAPVVTKELCGEKIEAILRLQPQVHRYGDGVEAKVNATLVRCKDWGLIWSAESGGSCSSRSPSATSRSSGRKSART
jgi:probable lipoprotein (TIGR04455 family)